MALPYISFAVGVLARIFVPFIQARRDDPTLGWDWRYVYPQLLTVAIVLLVLPLVVADINAIGQLPWQGAWLMGWGAADIGRLGDKAITGG